ncbi:MAG: nucleotide excision repair nuclease, Xpf [Candidatus Aramenus sulfurataquae]|jgi:DNA excision repair protein ERCC-4|uniref:Multidrug MFS transporter n=2 Tax=Candidatus Aramenus sulfurataquae TaxID=1326980 RepID=W7KVL5_9CREN|nr:MAG: nucleotide excision repair nuclease, Xpf [Candidatus Aramenus sulfurataquae]MCL7343325.1 multidrug MFS transporter [Candidatus Aramenus sulfurataquae]
MLRIYVDDRELNSGIPEILRELGIAVIIKQLSVGDYVISEDTAVERKTVSDLVNSVFDKRFFDQLERLSSTYANPFLVIEGDVTRIREITDRWKAVNSALVSATLSFNVKVLYSIDKRETAEILKKISEKVSSESKKRGITLHDKPKFENIKQEQEYLVEAFPQIGEILAKKLLEYFGTVRSICNASISELEKAIGSRRKAEEIFKIINTPYNTPSANSDSKRSLLDYFK